MSRYLILALSLLMTTPLLAQESKEPTGISPVLNPLFESPIIVEAPEGVSYNENAWESQTLLIPGQFIWERGGWMWPDHIRDWRLQDARLQWNDTWTKPERYGAFLRYTETTDDFDMIQRHVKFEEWLPVEDIHKCDALLAMQLAMKVHRITLLPEDVTSLQDIKDDVCQKKF